jgi:hypothetical protein
MLMEATDSNLITMGNDLAEKVSIVGKITGSMCNKNGIKLQENTIPDVVYVPAGQFNLFSLTKMILQGYTLGGDDKEICITIPMPKGMLFGMYICFDT